MSPGGKSESTDVGDRRLLSQAPFHDRANCLTWSSVMIRNRKSTSAKQGLRMSGIYMRRRVIVASSLKFPSVPGVPSPPICQICKVGIKVNFWKLRCKSFWTIYMNMTQMYENILTIKCKIFSEHGVHFEIGAKSYFLLFTAHPRNDLRKLPNIFPSSWKSSVGKFLIVLWCTLVHFLLPEETGNTFWQTLKSSKTCTQSSTSDDLLLLSH